MGECILEKERGSPDTTEYATYLDRNGTALKRLRMNQASVLEAGRSDTSGGATPPVENMEVARVRPLRGDWLGSKPVNDDCIDPPRPDELSEIASSLTVSYSF